MMTDDQRLRFEIMMTDSLDFHMGGTSGKDIPFYPIKLYTDDGKPNETMIAAFVALTGQTVNIKDAYEAKGFDFTGTKMFDEKTGYRSKSKSKLKSKWKSLQPQGRPLPLPCRTT